MECLINEQNYRKDQIIYPPDNYICTTIPSPQYDEYFNSQINNNINQKTSQVIMIDSNNFKINVDPGVKCFSIYTLFLTIVSFCVALLLLCILDEKIFVLIPFAFFSFLFTLAMICGCAAHYLIYLKIEGNSIILTKKSLLKDQVVTYGKGQLIRAEIFYKYDFRLDNYPCIFIFYLVTSSGDKIQLFQIGSRIMDLDLKGMKYFADLINYHISNNMRI